MLRVTVCVLLKLIVVLFMARLPGFTNTALFTFTFVVKLNFIEHPCVFSVLAVFRCFLLWCFVLRLCQLCFLCDHHLFAAVYHLYYLAISVTITCLLLSIISFILHSL